jgi:hypothetical protein
MSYIKIKRSGVSGNPTRLAQGELAYSYLADNGSNGGDRLYIGTGTESGSSSAGTLDALTHQVIGGKYFVDQINAATNANTASTIVKRDASGNFSAGTITAALSGNATTATTWATARNLSLTGDATATLSSVNGSADVSAALTLANVNSNVNSLAITAASGSGSTVTLTYATQASNPYTVGQQITVTGVSPSGYNGTYTVTAVSTTQVQFASAYTTAYVSGGTVIGLFGAQTFIPVITVNAKGLITAITNTAISTTLSLAGTSGTGSVNLNGGTLTVSGGNGITTSVSGSTVTISSIGAGGYTTTATAAGTTTLTSSSTASQFFTGSTTQTVKLPSTATLTLGQEYIITNNSTGVVTVQTSAAGAIGTIPGGSQATFTVASTGAETWVYEYTGYSTNTGTGANVLAVAPTITGHPTIEGVTSTGATGTGNFVFSSSPTISSPSISGHPTVEGVTSTGATGTGNFVFDTSPTLITPTLGAASATTINKVTITAPATSATLTIANGKTLTASNTLTFTGTDSSSVAFGTGGTVVYTSNNLSVFAATTSAQLAGVISDETGSGALVFGTSPTLTTPSITTSATFNGTSSGSTVVQATAAASGTLTLPAATDTLVGKATTDTFTNKTFDTAGTGNSFKINGTSITAVTGTGSVVLATSPSLTTPTIGSAGANFSGSTSGTITVAATAIAGTNTLTLPAATDTLVGRATTDTLTNKTINGANNTLTVRLANDVTGTLPVANGGTGTTTGSITGTGALTFTAGGSNTNVNLVPQGTGTVDVGSTRITNVATPTQSSDAATKGYVDTYATGLDVKQSVRVATTAALTATAGGSGVGKTLTNSGTQSAITIDSVVLVSGDRVLVKDQTTGADNGIYTVTTVGTASTNWVLTRATDADSNAEVTAGMFTFVEEGTVNADNGFVLSTNNPITLDTTSLTFVQFSGAGQITAGNGISKSGNTLSIDTSVTVDKTTAQTLTNKTLSTGSTWQGNLVTGTYGGTGVNNGSNTITIGGNVSTGGAVTFSGAYAFTGTLTAATSVTFPTTGTLVNTAVTSLSSLSTVGTITSGTWNGTTIGSGYGGTGFSTYATGDLIYASASNTLSKLTAATNGQVLQLVSGVPAWADLDGGTY